MKVLILGGFLGSGKTSLLIQLARYITDSSDSDSIYKVVILENEAGKEGIDDKLLRGNGFDVKNLFNGCACCTLSGELVAAAANIEKDYHPDWLVIETTGLAYPGLIQDNLANGIGMCSRICTVTDASRWNRLRIPMHSLLKGQAERADVILLNKTDLASEETLLRMEGELQEMNKDAQILRTSALDKIDSKLWLRVLGEEVK